MIRWALILAVACAGCSGSKLVIDSNTQWAGSVDGRLVSGHGHATFEKATPSCDLIAKKTKEGFLRVTVERNDPFRPTGEHGETSTEYGYVRVCGR